MSDDGRVSIFVSREIEAKAESVFDAWVDPAKARRWLFATEGGEIVRAEIDARPGGTFTIVDRRDGEDVLHKGTFEQVERPRHLAFDLTVPKYSSEATRVVVEILPMSAICELTLTHEGLRPEDTEKTHDGWVAVLDRLAATVGPV